MYISRSSYVRSGEHSLDRLYKPFHTVIYYRYLRFFPDGKKLQQLVFHFLCTIILFTCTFVGTVYYITSPDPPPSIVSKLRCHSNTIDAVLHGHYTLAANLVRLFCYFTYGLCVARCMWWLLGVTVLCPRRLEVEGGDIIGPHPLLTNRSCSW